MHHHPKQVLPFTGSDRVLEFLGWMALVILWCYTFMHYARLPETIPIHFNAGGQADGFGGKPVLLVLPVVATVLFIGMTVLNRYPHLFNYPVAIDAVNAMTQYTNATRMIRWLKLMIVLVFGLLTMHVVGSVHGHGLGPWLVPVILALVLLPLAFFLARAFRKGR